jgi:hypothetical protein
MLRKASELTEERKAAEHAERNRRDEAGLVRAVKAIEAAHAQRLNYCNDLTFSDWVVHQLEDAGYIVTLQPACGAGDVDTHTIEWD